MGDVSRVRAIVVKENKLLVMHRNKFGHEYDTLVGGGIDVGETPEQALKAAQDYFCKLAPPERIFSEELLKERRDEAARE